MGKLTLTNNSTISFGTGNHTISFSDSHLTGWTPGKKITITGWIGSPGASGTAGKIFVGNDATGLTAGQLAQISFTGYTGAQILPTGEIVPTAFTSPTLSSAINPTVDASFNISFTDNPTWRSAITSITVGGTILSASAYNTTVAGQITLTPSASTLLQTPGTKTIVVRATGYADATVSQTIGAGVPTSANSTATIDSPLARNSSSTITCTAKDQYNNLVQGYTFKYNAVITNADVTTSESYTIDGASVSSTATNSLSTTTSSSGVTTFTVGLPAAIDGGDGVSIQVKLGDGSTNIGSAFSYTEQTYNLNGTKYTADLSLNSFSDVTVSTGELTINTDASVKSITVAKGAKLTYSSGTLSTTNGIKLQNTDTGTASFVDTRTSDSPSPIAGTVEQAITETNRNWYVAIPVSGKYASDITLTGAKIVQRNEAQSRWDDVTGSLIPGVGYIAVASTNSGTTTWSLNGNLNSGKVQVDITNSGASYTGFNLLGNPYPSYLNWEQVLNLNTTNASLLQSSIWYRTAAYNSGTSKFDYTFNTYNSTGRISTPASTSGYIPPMQAFWVRANSAGKVTFTNAMRSHGDGASNKLKAPSANKVNQQILRLQISNGTNMDETVIYTNPNASNSFDNFDSPKMSNNSASVPEIFTVAGSEQLVINGMNCITPNQEISLGFTTGQSNAFSIKATEVSNFDAGTQVVLLDNQTNTQWNLTDGSAYNFSSDITSSNTSRFSIIFKSASVTTGNINNSDSNSIQIYRNDNNLIAVNCCNEIIGQASASVYNAAGQKLTEQNLQHSTTVFSKSFTAGLYLVSVTVNGKTTTQKVVIK